MTATRERTLGAVVFALLVVATVGAFFVTQRLKRSPAVVKQIHLSLYISPNGDHRKDDATVSFFLPKKDRVTASIVDARGDEVRRLADDAHLGRGTHSYVWTGRDRSGVVPPDGTYYLRVVLRGQGRATTAPRGIHLITRPPRPRIQSVTPARQRPGAIQPVTVRFSGPSSPPPLISVYRTDTGAPRVVARFAGLRGQNTARWNARDSGGRRVPPGTYAFAVTVQNKALVSGSWPHRLPPSAASAARGTGLTITGTQAAGPLEPVRAGDVARVTGLPAGSRYSLGSAKGRTRSPVTRVRIPRRTATGIHVLRAGRTAVPLVVRGRGSGGRVLVVVPAISWQGLNPVDDDANGFPNTLENSTSVALARPWAFGRLPAALRRETAPLTSFLTDRHLRYDLTTDVALASGHGPSFTGHAGVLLAGSELWLTEALDQRLRAFVEGGGKVASFGTDALRRTVTVSPQRLSSPSPPQDANVFGEEAVPAQSEAAPLVVHADSLGLFAGTDGFVGLFTRFEQQQRLVGGAQVQTGAGRDPAHPAFVAYRLGKGLVIRVGTPQWAPAIATDSEVAAVTRSTWELLSR